jgi:membrane fusion protein, copper/silver efflux system
MSDHDLIHNTPIDASQIDSPELISEAKPAPNIAGSTPAAPMIGWKRIRFLFKVVEIRLRFILVLVATFVLIGKWDTVKNVWEKWTRPAVAEVRAASDSEYFCPMHPSVVRDSLEPDGSVPKCPICGMPLSLHKKGQHIDLPEGVAARVQLSPERIQMANVSTATVEYRPLIKEIRAVGTVDYDETGRSRIVTRTAGYIEKLYVDKTYTPVSKGEPLAMFYSPDLLGTASDLTLALNRGATDLVESAKQRLKHSGIDDNEIAEIVSVRELLVALAHDDQTAAKQAQQALEKLGMAEAEVNDIKSTRRAPSGIVIRSPVSGHIINKAVVEGASVQAGDMLFDVADLSHVWVEADVFESDIPLLAKGQAVEVTFEGLLNRVFQGQILLVHPHIETATRTNRIRIDLPNPEHELRPGMYASVKVQIPFDQIEPFKNELAAESAGPQSTDDKTLIAFQKTCPVTGLKLGSMGAPVKRVVAKKTVFLCCPNCVEKFDASTADYLAKLAPPPGKGVLTVPERAVIDTGTKKFVYVEREPGQFDGIEVELGPLANGFYPVVKGLRAGDRVASAGAFLIDAETRLNPGAAAAFVGASGGPSGAPKASSTVAPRATKPAEKPAATPPEKPADAEQSAPPVAEKVTALTLAKPSADDLKNLDKLSTADRAAALAQQNCPITENALGSMGVPVKVVLAPGKSAFLCCPGCRDEATKAPQKAMDKLIEIARAVKEQSQK